MGAKIFTPQKGKNYTSKEKSEPQMNKSETKSLRTGSSAYYDPKSSISGLKNTKW